MISAFKIKEIIAEKVEGKIEPRHTDDGHFYEFMGTGKTVPSVTTIQKEVLVKPHLMPWAIKMGIEWLEIDDRWTRLKDPAYRNEYIVGAQIAHTEPRDDAGSVGTAAHEIIERYVKNWIRDGERPLDIRFYAKPDTDPRSIAATRAFEQLCLKHNITPLASEILVGDERYSAGTLDLLVLWDGELVLTDVKTSNSVSDEYASQTACYSYFFTHMTGLKIKQIKILHLSKDMDKFTIYKVNQPYKAYQAFKGICNYHRWRFGGTEKLIKDIKKVKL